MSKFDVTEEYDLFSDPPAWVVEIRRDGKRVSWASSVTSIEDARDGAIRGLTIADFADFEAFERREERIGFVWGAVFAVALVVLVVFLVAWEVVT